MANKVVVLFVEGPTEIEFYKAVIERARDLMQAPFECFIEYIDMKGIGNYKRDARRQFLWAKRKYENDAVFYAFLCVDSDAFQFSKRPPVNLKDVHKELKEAGAKKTTDIIANLSIEEWFLADLSGVLSYLRLPPKTKRPKGNGQDSLKKLFKMANRVYVKGSKTEGFIKSLNISIIMSKYCSSLLPLCKEIGFDCTVLCSKQIMANKKT